MQHIKKKECKWEKTFILREYTEQYAPLHLSAFCTFSRGSVQLAISYESLFVQLILPVAAFHFQMPGRSKGFYISSDTLQDPKKESNTILCVYWNVFFSNSMFYLLDTQEMFKPYMDLHNQHQTLHLVGIQNNFFSNGWIFI